MFDKILEIVAPHTCCGCGAVGPLLCEHCINDITTEPFAFCMVCTGLTSVDNLCRNCRKNTNWEGAWVVGARKDALKQLIDLYKFERAMAADAVLASLLLRRLPQFPADTVVTYVPAASAHARQRGYDTMARVAVCVAHTRGLRVLPLVMRTKDVVQRDANRQQRLTQQYEALTARATSHSGPILLLDDIYTTGGTLRAATKKLKERYSQPVYVAVIARQPLDDLSDL